MNSRRFWTWAIITCFLFIGLVFRHLVIRH